MTVTNATHSTQAFEAYARVANERTERLRAEKAADTVRTATQTARVRKRSVGFSLGKFGIDFTAQEVELAPREMARPMRREGFDADLEAAAILRAAQETNRGGDAPPQPDSSPLTRHRALQAYAESSLDFAAPAAPGRTIGSV